MTKGQVIGHNPKAQGMLLDVRLESCEVDVYYRHLIFSPIWLYRGCDVDQAGDEILPPGVKRRR